MWVRGLGWERIPRGLRRRSNRGDSFSPPSVLAAEMMSACGELPWKTPKNQFPAPHSDRPSVDVGTCVALCVVCENGRVLDVYDNTIPGASTGPAQSRHVHRA